MMSLPRAFAMALGQLGDPAIVRVLGKSLLLTLAIFAVLGGLLWWALQMTVDRWLTQALPADYGPEVAGLVALVIALIGGWLLFRFVALAVLQFFADDVVAAVEARHYPGHAATARKLPFAKELSNSLRSTGRALLVNLIALPFALLLLVTGIGTALLFWAVNGWLLGRELQDMVWLRHRQDKHAIAPMGDAQRFLLGGAVAALMMVPFANLLAPVLGAASATHMVHRGRSLRA